MKIAPEIRIENRQIQEKKQKKELVYDPNKFRKNNRKNTLGRYTQKIIFLDDTVFPPVIKTKYIKHIKF